MIDDYDSQSVCTRCKNAGANKYRHDENGHIVYEGGTIVGCLACGIGVHVFEPSDGGSAGLDIMRFAIREAWQESRSLYPDPQWHVSLNTLTTYVRGRFGISQDQILALDKEVCEAARKEKADER
jgi:hypothetical protein